MRKYEKKAQVLLTERQYRDLQAIAEQQQKPLGALLRDAAEEVYLKQNRSHDKAQAVQALLSLTETEVPDEYHDWEEQYLSHKASHGSG